VFTRAKKILCHILIITLSLFFFAACKGKSNDSEVIKAMEKNLLQSNATINRSTETILKSLQDKTTNWGTMERAKIWYGTAQKIGDLSQKLYNHLNTLKQRGTFTASELQELNKSLIDYKKELLSSDSSIRDEFSNQFDFFNPVLSLFLTDILSTNKLSTKNISKANFLASLTLLQNYIKINENKIIAFCHTKVGETDGGGFFNYYSAMVGQSSTYVRPGEKLEITAGVGAFSKSCSPVININGKNTSLGYEGFALYKMNAPKFPGKYKVPVQISFLNQTTGKEETISIKVEYTVAKECN